MWLGFVLFWECKAQLRRSEHQESILMLKKKKVIIIVLEEFAVPLFLPVAKFTTR